MGMRRLTPHDYRRMPWRNGGGTTMELAVEPGSSSRFLHRVSVADVASDGPFSRFEGYDRHIMLLEGAGMALDCGAEGRIDLADPFVPRRFSGDWDVYGTLVRGPVRDFNVIVDRTRATSSLEVRVLEAAWEIAEGAQWIVHVLEGSLEDADAGDTLIGHAATWLKPRRKTRVAIARVVPVVAPV
jgi:environmental stress-induced protein Ves